MGRIFFYFYSSCLAFYCLKNVTCFDRPDEAELFKKSAQNAYALFRDKAAMSRSMAVRICLSYRIAHVSSSL
jgi:hypothetical protein